MREVGVVVVDELVDAAAQLLEAGAALQAASVEAIQVVLAHDLLALACFENAVGADKDLVGDADAGSFLPSP